MVNPDRPWPRPETPRAPLDATAGETLELWCAQPEWDTRSLEEFAADGGRPEGPPNRSERGNEADGLVAFFAFVWGLPFLVFKLAREVFRFFRGMKGGVDRFDREGRELERTITLPRAPRGGTGETRRGRFYELPPGLELRPLAPPPPPPSTPMLTGYLRDSLAGGAGGNGRVIVIHREDRRALRDELPPVYPDDDEDDERPTMIGGPR